jgi:hypothetical protein
MIMLRRHVLIALVLLGMCAARAAASADAPDPVFATDEFDFGRVQKGAIVEHEFLLRNTGTAPLHVHKASMTPPLVATTLPSIVPPGGQAPLRFRLDTSALQGLVETSIAVSLGAPAVVHTLTIQGYVVPPIELVPGPVFFLAVTHGESNEQSIEIVNHEAAPLRITGVDHGSAPFATRLDTVEEGKRYRLTIHTRPDAALGRRSDTIVVTTSSQTKPRIALRADTLVRERVATFPESVDIGALSLAQLRANPTMAVALAQKLVVYGSQTKDFTISASTDLAMLGLQAERSASGERWQITATLRVDRLREGPISGSLRIETNDPEFPTLHVPVEGAILP